MQSGVYKITNVTNGHFYIGSSKNIAARWKQHKSASAQKSAISAAIRKYGVECFSFEVIELCDPVDLPDVELSYIRALDPQYNLKIATETAGFTHNELTRARLSQAHMGKSLSGEHRDKISRSTKGLPSARGWNHSDEARQKISAALLGNTRTKGRKHTDEWRKEMSARNAGEKNPFFGKKQSEEAREKVRLARTGSKSSEETRSKVSASLVGNKRTLGLKHTDEAKAKVSAANKGKVISADQKEKISSSLRGHAVSEETRAKMRAARLAYLKRQEG